MEKALDIEVPPVFITDSQILSDEHGLSTSHSLNSQFMYAVQAGHLNAVKHHVEKSKISLDLDELVNGMNVVSIAAASGNVQMLEYILSLGPKETRPKMDTMKNALIAACCSGHVATVDYLITHFEYLNPSNTLGHSEMTPLMLAACAGKTNVIKYLLDKNPDLSIKNRQGKTVIDLAQNLKDPELITLFECHKSSSNDGKSNSKNKLSLLLSVSGNENLNVEPECVTPKSRLSPSILKGQLKRFSPFKCLKRTPVVRKRRSRSTSDAPNETKPKKNLTKKTSGYMLEYVLKNAGLDQVYPIFEENEVTFSSFLALTDYDLKNMGIKRSQRDKLLKLGENYKWVFEFYLA